MMTRTTIIAILVALLPSVALPEPAGEKPTTEIRLIARADDMGAAQAINEGCIEAYKSGIVRSVEVIVPGPWFLDAVRLLKEHPDLDVGVHLTLTSEWERVKWRPLTWVTSFVDADGYFHPSTEAFISNKINLAEVERELKAQIEMARRHLGAERITHLSAHMNAAVATPQLKAITEKLAKQYNLRTDNAVKPAGRFGDRDSAVDEREDALVKLLERLEPGDWLVVEHPGFDTPETRSLGHKGYENVASDRSNVRRAFMSNKAAKVIKQRGIKLISYRDL
jgi:chitin disaccharide deacetylase